MQVIDNKLLFLTNRYKPEEMPAELDTSEFLFEQKLHPNSMQCAAHS